MHRFSGDGEALQTGEIGAGVEARCGGIEDEAAGDSEILTCGEQFDQRLVALVQIDGDNALTLPVSIGVAAGSVRLLQPA